MSTLTLECPDEVMASLKKGPHDMVEEIRLAAAMKLHELGRLSSGRAAQLAGISRVEFLHSTGRYQVSAFSLSESDLEQDLENA